MASPTMVLGVLCCMLGLVTAAAPRAVWAADPFEINAITAQTGQAAFLGDEESSTLQLIAELVNKSGGIQGRPIKFVIADDQSNPQVAVQLTNGLIAKKVALMIGPTITAACGAVMPLLKDGPADYCLSPGVHPPAGSYMFSAAFSTVDACAALIHYLRQRGWTKIAMITSTDATGQDAERNVDAAIALPQNGGDNDRRPRAFQHHRYQRHGADGAHQVVAERKPSSRGRRGRRLQRSFAGSTTRGSSGPSRPRTAT